MRSKLLIATGVALSFAFCPLTTIAAESTSPAEMTKDAWLKEMNPELPGVICKGFTEDADLKKRFDELKISYDDCLKLIPDISKRCQDENYAKIPAMINDQNATTWGRNLGECIGKNFAEKYLLPK